MTQRRHTGTTLAELLVVLAVSGLVAGVVFVIPMQLGKIFASTNVIASAQTRELTVMQLIQQDLQIGTHITCNDPTWVTITQPMRKNGFIDLTLDSTTKKYKLTSSSGALVQYFLGKHGIPTPTTAGDSLFRAVGSPVNGSFPGAQEIITGIAGTQTPDPTRAGQVLGTTIFSVATDQHSLNVTLSAVSKRARPTGPVTELTVMTSQGYVRNIQATSP